MNMTSIAVVAAIAMWTGFIIIAYQQNKKRIKKREEVRSDRIKQWESRVAKLDSKLKSFKE
jgi:hypothetical protein